METRTITKEAIFLALESKIQGTDYFIVNVALSPNKQILIEIDSKIGVSIDFCVEISKYISAVFAEEIDEYSLEVASAGISQPFRVLQQYEKFIDKEVEVLAENGLKHVGILSKVSPENFTIQVTKKVKLEGAKRKTEVTEELVFNYREIKHTKYNFRF